MVICFSSSKKLIDECKAFSRSWHIASVLTMLLSVFFSHTLQQYVDHHLRSLLLDRITVSFGDSSEISLITVAVPSNSCATKTRFLLHPQN